jgi:hypothetical protein
MNNKQNKKERTRQCEEHFKIILFAINKYMFHINCNQIIIIITSFNIISLQIMLSYDTELIILMPFFVPS